MPENTEQLNNVGSIYGQPETIENLEEPQFNIQSSELQASGETRGIASDIQDILGTERDDAGNYILDVERTKLLRQDLQETGLLAVQPSEVEIAEGVKRARELVDKGLARNYLGQLPFIDSEQESSLRGNVKSISLKLHDTLYVKPDLIAGAPGAHTSWAGRGENGDGEVAHREEPRTRASFEQIIDYATRETQLPKLGFGLDVILTPTGPVLFTENSHTTSAAKLRGEPLGFSWMRIYDAR